MKERRTASEGSGRIDANDARIADRRCVVERANKTTRPDKGRIFVQVFFGVAINLVADHFRRVRIEVGVDERFVVDLSHFAWIRQREAGILRDQPSQRNGES